MEYRPEKKLMRKTSNRLTFFTISHWHYEKHGHGPSFNSLSTLFFSDRFTVFYLFLSAKTKKWEERNIIGVPHSPLSCEKLNNAGGTIIWRWHANSLFRNGVWHRFPGFQPHFSPQWLDDSMKRFHDSGTVPQFTRKFACQSPIIRGGKKYRCMQNNKGRKLK